jgi:NAD(P)-dependent dehydrogenase (short-subunit alcohol dehydrogenase family)
MLLSRRSYDPAGKVAVVTGAGSGIGRSIARLLVSRGARVHAADIDGSVTHTVDVSDAAAVERLAADVLAAEGRVDLLFNNAGIGHAGDVADTPLEDWRRIVDVNLMGVVHGVHAFVPRMLAQGAGAHIVNTASLAGLVANPGMVPYCTTKFAVVGLSEALDLELRGSGIRVSALCPGVIDTAIVRTSTLRGQFEGRRERIAGLYERRGTSPDAVAEAALAAVAARRVIQPAPRSHVLPAWLLKRYAPPAGRAMTLAVARVTDRLR